MKSIQNCLVEEFLRKVLVSRQRSELNKNEVEVCQQRLFCCWGA